MDIKELTESYFVQKDGIKRHQILLKITFQCEYASKEFFEKAFDFSIESMYLNLLNVIFLYNPF